MLELTDREVLELASKLFATSKVDLRSYAKSSLKRRFIRLSELHAISTHDDLLKYISTISDPTQVVNTITVNTTEMYRDPSFWLLLRTKILPSLAINNTINIWHAGCSSGEEVISMQILLEEMGLRNKTNTFACDINSAVLEAAKASTYKTKDLKLSENNYKAAGGCFEINKYISKINDVQFTFDADLLSKVEFRKFDLVQDTTYKKFDLILCRNVLIYFEFELQEQVITKFTNTLYSGGCIAIGQQESIINYNLLQRLRSINDVEKIYRLIN